MPPKHQTATACDPNAPCFRCAFTQDFHDKMITTLSALDTGQSAIIDRLDHVNGSVAELFRRSNDANREIAVLQSAGSLPVQELKKKVSAIDDALKAGKYPPPVEIDRRVGAVEMAVANQAASQKGARGVLKVLAPLMYTAIAGVLILLFQHADSIIPLLKAKGVTP